MLEPDTLPDAAIEPPDPNAASELLMAFAEAYIQTNSRKKGLALIQATLARFPDEELSALIPFGAPRKVKVRQKARREARAALVAMMPTLLSKLPVE